MIFVLLCGGNNSLIHVSEYSNQKVARSFTREGLAGVANFYPALEC